MTVLEHIAFARNAAETVGLELRLSEAEHGRGRALMELLMDSVEYLSQGGETLVRMRKKRSLVH
jgi:anti-sigma regulatory factor (Ser/Thr protein kinase)